MYSTHMLWISNSIKVKKLCNFWVGGILGGKVQYLAPTRFDHVTLSCVVLNYIYIYSGLLL